MFDFLVRAPFTFISLIREVNQNKNFSLAERIQAFVVLSGIFLQQRFRPQVTETVKAEIFNYNVKAYNYQTLIFLFREIFLSEAYHFKTSNKAPVIIDGGANIGMSVLYFKILYPHSKIVAFEPNPDALELFQQNIENNNLQGITLIPTGLGRDAGEMLFFLDERKGGLEASFQRLNTQRQLKVRVEKLSEYIKVYEPELVKLDVEGAESGIMDELKLANALAIPKQYIIEYHQPEHNRENAFADFRQMFLDAGFLYQIRNRGTASATDDLLLYFYR
jgi:FkbM family methyltransferase